MPRMTKRARRCARSWPDLPPELLGDVLDRLPAFGDRLRLRAVCRQWRRAERAHAQPPPMPWLVAAGHCVDIHDAAVHRVALPDDARAAACRGSFGNWLALVPVTPPPCQPFLLHPFTMARIQLPLWTGGTISKIVMSSAPDSENCTVAAVDCSEYTGVESRFSSVAICRLRQRDVYRPWWGITETFTLEDIAFFQGKLHAVDAAQQTYAFGDDELDEMHDRPLYHGPPLAPLSWHRKYYLVACHERLLMVCRSFGVNRAPGWANHSVRFKVFVAPDSNSFNNSWRRPPPLMPVKSFDGHAIFVGGTCCRAFLITNEGSKIRPDQICYADDERSTSVISDYNGLGGTFHLATAIDDCRRPLRSLQSYDMRTDCFRKYQQQRPTGPWQCVMVQRLLHSEALPPPSALEWGATLLLWEVMSSLGANRVPHYGIRRRMPQDADSHTIVDVDLFVLVYNHSWRFTQSGRSVQEAKQETAREAVTFLRSRYRSALDDSPWSSIPHYHSHVIEEVYAEEDDEEEE